MMSRTQTTLRVAIDAVADACRVSRALQSNLDRLRQMLKDDRSPVTVADFVVQAIVQIKLSLAEERCLIVGEESAAALRDPDNAKLMSAVAEAVQAWREGVTEEEVIAAVGACDHDPSEEAAAQAYWTLDPIDGTKGFLRGRQYAIALARIEDGRVTLGVMGCPNLSMDHARDVDDPDPRGTIYAATLGGGAWELPGDRPGDQPERVRVAEMGGGGVRVCESVEAAHSKQDETQRVLARLGEPGAPVRLDSQCKYAVVARGQADAYLRMPTSRSYVEKIWDHAAGSLIATEAGAIVTDISGAALDFSRGRTLSANRGIICASPAAHERILDALRELSLAGDAGA